MRTIGQVAPSKLFLGFLAAAFCAAACIAVPRVAYADGGVVCTGHLLYADTSSDGRVSPEPGYTESQVFNDEAGRTETVRVPFYFAAIDFDKNVSFSQSDAGAEFVERNLERIHIVRVRDGYEVATHAEGAKQRDERQVIYLYLDEWMDPLADYEIVVDAGIEAANGQDVTSQEYRIPFTTSEQCENGLTVFQIAGVAGVAVMLVAGASVAARRVKKERTR